MKLNKFLYIKPHRNICFNNIIMLESGALLSTGLFCVGENLLSFKTGIEVFKSFLSKPLNWTIWLLASNPSNKKAMRKELKFRLFLNFESCCVPVLNCWYFFPVWPFQESTVWVLWQGCCGLWKCLSGLCMFWTGTLHIQPAQSV